MFQEGFFYLFRERYPIFTFMLKWVFLVFLLSQAVVSSAQKYTEIGMNFGLAGVQGELNRVIDPWFLFKLLFS